MSDVERKMTFLEHLEELRRRLIRCAIAVLGGMIVCWFFREEFRAFLEAPLYEAWSQVDGLPPPEPLHFTGLIEPFVAYLKLSAVGGIFVASPVILYQLWRFISPGLYPRERKVAAPFVIVSTLLFVGGSAMAYTLVFPIGFRFFLKFAAGRDAEVLEAEVVIVEAVPPLDPKLDGGTPGPPVPDSANVGTTSPVPAAANVDTAPPEVTAVDAGADAGLHYGGDAGVDAGAQDVADAGASPDAGIATTTTTNADAGPVTAPDSVTPDTIDIDEEPSWFEQMLEWVLHRIVRSGCREFAIEPDANRARLRFDWNEKSCGPPPVILGLMRGEEPLEIEWIADRESSRPGKVALQAVDTPPAPGTYTYVMRISSGPVAEGQLAPLLMIKEYLSFAMRLLLAFGLIFELPILITFLSIAGIVNYRQLLKFSRWFVVLAVVFAAMLTPPDIITQVLLATPLVILYFISVLVAYVFGPKPDS